MATVKLATLFTSAAVGCFLLRSRTERERKKRTYHRSRFSNPATDVSSEFLPASNLFGLVRSFFWANVCCHCDAEFAVDAWPLSSPSVHFRQSSPFYAGATRVIPTAAAVADGERVLRRYREQCGAPAIVAAVSVDGRIVWETGLGYADVEQCVRARPDTIMRIASISKCITAVMAAYFVECGWLDLDKPIQEYIGETAYTFKEPDGNVALITTRQLLSHMGGVRHYRKIEQNDQSTQTSIEDTDSALSSANAGRQGSALQTSAEATSSATTSTPNSGSAAARKVSGDGQYPEFYLNNAYKTAQDSLSIFKDDPLLSKPGEKFLYTTFGYTLLSAVLEKAAEQAAARIQAEIVKTTLNAASVSDEKSSTESDKIPKTAAEALSDVKKAEQHKKQFSFQNLFRTYFIKRLGLFETCIDNNEQIIPNRARYYQRDTKTHHLKNTPEVDNSCKWAGGGVLSTAPDLVRFGNALLVSEQKNENSSGIQTFLRPASVRLLWQSVKGTENPQGSDYGLGFALKPRNDWFLNAQSLGAQSAYMQNVKTRIVYHSGGAVGASSILVILPRGSSDDPVITTEEYSGTHPRGVVVAIMCNLQDVHLYDQALELCRIFDRVTPLL